MIAPDIRFDPPWLTRLRAEVGILEAAGAADNQRIATDYHGATKGGPAPDSVAWCSSVLCFVFEASGIISPRNKRSHAWMDTGWGIRLAFPLVGAVMFFDHGGGTGHVTLFEGQAPNRMFAGLGGNQGNQVKRSFYKLDEVDAILWPAIPIISPDGYAPPVRESTR